MTRTAALIAAALTASTLLTACATPTPTPTPQSYDLTHEDTSDFRGVYPPDDITSATFYLAPQGTHWVKTVSGYEPDATN